MKKIALTIGIMLCSFMVPLTFAAPAEAHSGDCTSHRQTAAENIMHNRAGLFLDSRWTLRLNYTKCLTHNGLNLSHFHPITFRLKIVREGDLRCDNNGPPDSFRSFRMNPSNIGRWDFSTRTFDCVPGKRKYVKRITFAGAEADRMIGPNSDRCFQFHWQLDMPLVSDPNGLSPSKCI